MDFKTIKRDDNAYMRVSDVITILSRLLSGFNSYSDIRVILEKLNCIKCAETSTTANAQPFPELYEVLDVIIDQKLLIGAIETAIVYNIIKDLIND